jgi:hypothetical protein
MQPGVQMVDFLAAYVNQRAINAPSLSSPELDEKIFNLIFRFISEGRDISAWVDWIFVVGITCCWYDSRRFELAALLTRVWRRARTKMDEQFTQLRDYYIHSFEAIITDEANDIVPTLTGLRLMVTLNSDILDLLVENDGEFLIALDTHYGVYRADLDVQEKKAVLYLFYTIIVSLAYRASDATVGQNKKGKGTVGSAETLFFGIFDHLFGEYIRGGRYDALIEDVSRLTPFVDIMAEWKEGWKGADEAVETLILYLERSKVEEQSQDEAPLVFTDGKVCFFEFQANL